MSMRRSLGRLILGSQEQTYTYLLIALLLFITVTPFLPRARGLAWINDYLLVLVLVAATRNISKDRRHLWVGAALGLPAVASRLTHAHVAEMSTAGAVLVAASTIAFFGFLVALVMNDILRGRRHIGEKVTGSIVAYLLIGLLWTFVYGLIELLEPGSFAIPQGMLAWLDSKPLHPPSSVFLYYSFVTLTTLGYGDITPVSDAARTFSVVEAVVGQLFIAITIARLVGLHASAISDDSAESSGARDG